MGAQRTGHAVEELKRVQVDDAQRRGNITPGQLAGGAGAWPQDREGERANKAKSPLAGPAGRRLQWDAAERRGVLHTIGRRGWLSWCKDIKGKRKP